MKILDLLLFLTLCFPSEFYAAELPKYKYKKLVSTGQLGATKSLSLHISIDLPEGQKLNNFANSKILIHEQKSGKKWTKVKEIKVNSKVVLDGWNLNFSEAITLANNDSKIAISSTLYHCARDGNGACYIDNFQKTLTRSKETGKDLAVRFFLTKD